MSCDTRHRAIIANLLTLAGLTDTVDADTVIRSGSGRRRQRGDPHGPESHLPPLHDEVRPAMGSIGHGADTLPAWGPALIALLVRSANTDRRSFLTLQLLTGGWDAVTPLLTDHDSAWLLTAAHIGLPLPAAVATRLASLPAAAPIVWTLPDPMRRAVGLVTVLEALIGIDDVPPAAVQAVTPRQVLQVAVGGPVASRSDLQAVLRAVLEHTPAAAHALRFVAGGIGAILWRDTEPTPPPIVPPSSTRPTTLDEQGIARVLADVAAKIQTIVGSTFEPTVLRDPSPRVVATILDVLTTRPLYADDLGSVLAALMQLWRMEGREDTVTATIRRLETMLTHHRDDLFIVRTVATLLAAGVVGPPHGDAVLAQLCIASCVDPIRFTAWDALAGAAVYVATCQQHGHRPPVDEMDALVRTWWRTRTSWFVPSPIPLLAVGREHELLLPVIHAERDTDRQTTMLLDCVDAMAMLAIVGGATDGFRTVLRDVVTTAHDPLDPRVVIRLAADRDGQAVLAHLPSVPTPPAWTEDTRDHYHRLIPHLVSPAWMTAPPPLRTWWTTTLRHVTASSDASVLDRPPPLYPTVAPQAAVVRPTRDIVARAVAHPAWATLPTTERQESLTQVFRSGWSIGDVLPIVARAATTTAVADIQATLPHAEFLASDTVHDRQAPIDDALRWSS